MKKKSVHRTQNKNYDSLTKREHVERELELWGIITGLEIRLKELRTKKAKGRKKK